MTENPASDAASFVFPPVEAQICYALYSTHLAMNKVYRKALKSVGLTYPQYLVMQVLWERDGIDLGSIGGRLGLDSATLTPLLKRLESDGLVERARARDDERHVVITLTARGRELRNAAAEVPPQIMAASACGVDELAAMITQLGKLRENLVGNA